MGGSNGNGKALDPLFGILAILGFQNVGFIACKDFECFLKRKKKIIIKVI
jgi:hypothetical protein